MKVENIGKSDPLFDSREAISPVTLRRVVVATFLGQIMEWYDYGIYALVSVQIGATFFPSDDPVASILSALAVFGLAFLARPIGGIIIGRYGDRVGRKAVLVFTLVLMTIATAAIAAIPGARTLGWVAPCLLAVARLLQGMAAAGEASSSLTYVAETVPPERKGFFAALLMSGNSAGFLLATLMIWVLREVAGDTAFDDWAWRLAFLFALPLGLVSFYIRHSLSESPAFERMQKDHSLSASPVIDMLTRGMGELLQAVGISAASFVANYLLVGYLPLALRTAGYSARETSIIGVATTLTLLISYPFMGALSDRIGRAPVILGAAAFLAMFGWPAFILVEAGFWPTMISVMLLALATAAFIACFGLFCLEFIDPSRLMTTYSTGFNVSAAIFGGSSLWVFGKLTEVTGDPRMPATYLALVSALSFFTLLSVLRARRRASAGAR